MFKTSDFQGISMYITYSPSGLLGKDFFNLKVFLNVRSVIREIKILKIERNLINVFFFLAFGAAEK